nr:transposase [Peptacetobacter hominis]
MVEYEIDIPQDRDSSFEAKIIQKRQKDISEIEERIINIYALGMGRNITEQIEDIYGFELPKV